MFLLRTPLRVARSFFQNLHQYFLSPCRIIAGDFNCVDNKLDHVHVLNDSLSDKSIFRRLMSDCSLIDVWRKQHPRGISNTWANANYSQASRLDCFLVSGSLERCIDCPKVFPCSFSDHDFVTVGANFFPFVFRFLTYLFRCILFLWLRYFVNYTPLLRVVCKFRYSLLPRPYFIASFYGAISVRSFR